MKAKELSNELHAGFSTAFDVLMRSVHGQQVLWQEEVKQLLTACANNAAQGLADRTISDEAADRLAELGVSLDDVVASYLMEVADKIAGGQ